MSYDDNDVWMERELGALRNKHSDLSAEVWMACRKIKDGEKLDATGFKALVLQQVAGLMAEVSQSRRKDMFSAESPNGPEE